MTFTATTTPILGLYNANGAFPTGGPSAWASGPTTNLAATYIAWGQDIPTYIESFVSECIAGSLVPFVELEPWNSGPSWNVTPLFSSITGGSWDTWLLAIGTYIASVSSPVILTFAHEFNINDNQYPWNYLDTGSGPGGGTLTAAEWIAGWTYVKNKINSTANGNALWMWAPGASVGGNTYDPSPWWPSGALPDMVGLDAYPSTVYGASLGTFAGQIAPTITIIRNLGWTKPIYIAETNLAAMENGPVVNGVQYPPGQTISAFVAAMAAAGVSGVFEFEEYYEPDMTPTQWTEYNTAVAANYGGGGGGGGGTSYSYTQTVYDSFPGTTVNTSLWTEPVDNNGISVSGGSLKIEGLVNQEQVMLMTSFDRNLADGIFGLQFTQTGTAPSGTIPFLGIADAPVSAGGNAYEFQNFPFGGSGGAAGSWYSWAFSGTNVSGDTGSQSILSPSAWNNGSWIGIGNYNLNDANDVHVYKSPDGVTWTEVASFTVTGAIDESAVGLYFGVEYDSGVTGSSNYLVTVDNVSWFARGTGGGGGGGGGGESGTFSLYTSMPSSGGTSVTNTGTLGLLIESTEAGTLPEIAFYSPSGSTVLPSAIGVWTVSGETLVTSQTPAWSGAAGSGEVTATVTADPAIAASTQYMIGVFGVDLNYYFIDSYWSSGAGENGITSGPLTAGGGTGTQGWYNPGSSLAYPSSQYDSGYFGIDVQLAVAAPSSPAGPSLLLLCIA